MVLVCAVLLYFVFAEAPYVISMRVKNFPNRSMDFSCCTRLGRSLCATLLRDVIEHCRNSSARRRRLMAGMAGGTASPCRTTQANPARPSSWYDTMMQRGQDTFVHINNTAAGRRNNIRRAQHVPYVVSSEVTPEEEGETRWRMFHLSGESTWPKETADCRTHWCFQIGRMTRSLCSPGEW